MTRERLDINKYYPLERKDTFTYMLKVLHHTDDFRKAGDNKIDALMMALMEEVGELAHEFKRQYKQGKTAPNKHFVALEAGDVLRIIFLLMRELGVEDDRFIRSVVDKWEEKYS